MVALLVCVLVGQILQSVLSLNNYEKCHPSRNGAIVQAFNCFYPPIKSCKSSSDYNKEVHVIHLLPPGSSNLTTLMKESIKIHLDRMSINNASLVLILYSDIDVSWHLVAPDYFKWNMVVWISQNATVKNSKVKVMHIQLLDKKLSDWIKKKFGTISSHMEVAYPIDVIQLQLDKGTEKQCHLREIKLQRISYKKRDATVLNCIFHDETPSVQTKNGHRKVIHVIEFHSLPSGDLPANSSSKPVVTLSLKAKKALRNVQATIIIKSNVEVIFKVKTGSFMGRISMHTNQMVSNDAVFNQLLEVSAESLDFLSSEELYERTTSYHGIPLSFSKIFEANLIEVSINPEEQSIISYVMGAPPSEETIHWSPDNPLDVDDVSVVCHDEYFSVAITRHNDFPSCDWLTLLDERCHARSNSTHCIIDSKYGQCRTCAKERVMETGDGCHGDDDGGKYKNEILFHNMDNKTSSKALNLLKLDCSSSSAIITSSSNSSESIVGKGNVYFKLIIHAGAVPSVEDIEKSHHYRKFYVEAIVDPEGSMLAIVEDCQLESMTPWKTGYVHHLMKKRCPVGSVEWWRYPTKDKPLPSIFSFVLDDAPFTSKDSDGVQEKDFWRVVCRVAPCFINDKMAASDIPQCGPEDYNRCLGSSFVSRPLPSLKRLFVNVTSYPISSFASEVDQLEGLKVGQNGDDDDDIGRDREREKLLLMVMAGGDAARRGDLKSNITCPEKHKLMGEYVSMEIGIIVSFCAFLIGALSMSALWFIYAKTRPKKLIGSKHLRSPDTSGESTPSSTSPITICQIKRSK